MITTKEFLEYGMYLCKYYDIDDGGCSDECPFAKNNEGKKISFCVFPEYDENTVYDIDFAIKAVEEFKNKIAKPISLMDYMKKVMPYSTDFYKIQAPCTFFKGDDFVCNTNDGRYCEHSYEDCWKRCTITVMPDEMKEFLKKL